MIKSSKISYLSQRSVLFHDVGHFAGGGVGKKRNNERLQDEEIVRNTCDMLIFSATLREKV